eukprot:4270716-Lingulodinium_polyedra.AAC.1
MVALKGIGWEALAPDQWSDHRGQRWRLPDGVDFASGDFTALLEAVQEGVWAMHWGQAAVGHLGAGLQHG